METGTEQVERLIPVNLGERMMVRPTGLAKSDPYYSRDGYIVFIKNLPEGLLNSVVRVRVKVVKENYAIAEYEEGTA